MSELIKLTSIKNVGELRTAIQSFPDDATLDLAIEVNLPNIDKSSEIIGDVFSTMCLESATPKMMDFGFDVPSTVDQPVTITKKVWEMTPEEVQQCCKEGKIKEVGSIGDTFGDGKYTYTIIGINQDIPCDSRGIQPSKDNYQDVLTVMCLGAPIGPGNGSPVTMDASKTPWGIGTAQMNSSDTTSGVSWKDSNMRKNVMSAYLNKIPVSTRNAIGYVQKVTGQYNGDSTGGENITTGDKCFLLSEKEIFGKQYWSTQNEQNETFQYQYFANIATIQQSININEGLLWLRSPYYYGSGRFCSMSLGNAFSCTASYSGAVFPAMCVY